MSTRVIRGKKTRRYIAPICKCYVGNVWPLGGTVTTVHGINPELDLEHGAIQSRHPGGAHFAFVDGHVSFIGETVDKIILERLVDKADRQPLPVGSY